MTRSLNSSEWELAYHQECGPSHSWEICPDDPNTSHQAPPLTLGITFQQEIPVVRRANIQTLSVLLSLFYWWEIWNTERLSNLPKVTELLVEWGFNPRSLALGRNWQSFFSKLHVKKQNKTSYHAKYQSWTDSYNFNAARKLENEVAWLPPSSFDRHGNWGPKRRGDTIILNTAFTFGQNGG